MTHFVDAGERTSRPETLSVFEKVRVLLSGVRIPRPRNLRSPASRDMPFRTHRFIGRSNIQYEAWHIPCADSRGLCILFHGYANCKVSLLPEAQAWRELGFETFLVDFRGSGGSGGHETTIGFREADDVVAACDYVRRELTTQPPILYGCSMGAVAVLRAISEYGLEPRAVVVECPFDRLLSTVKNRFSAMGVPSFPSAQLLVFWGGVQHGYSAFKHNPVEYAKQVPCPILMMNGEQDLRVTKEQAKATFESFPGQKQLVFFTGVSHESCVVRNADRWKRAVTDFLNDEASEE